MNQERRQLSPKWPEQPPSDRPRSAGWGDEWDEQNRIERAKELGLPEDTSWDEICVIWDKQERIALARKLGLTEDTELHELDRVDEVRRLGLPEDSSWTEIYRAWDEEARVTLAKELGLEKEWTGYISWKNILARLLDIDIQGPVSMNTIIEKVREIQKEEGER